MIGPGMRLPLDGDGRGQCGVQGTLDVAERRWLRQLGEARRERLMESGFGHAASPVGEIAAKARPRVLELVAALVE